MSFESFFFKLFEYLAFSLRIFYKSETQKYIYNMLTMGKQRAAKNATARFAACGFLFESNLNCKHKN